MPDQKGINVSEHKVARSRGFPGALYMFKNPPNFQTTEICGERQPSLAAESILASRFRQLANVVCDPRVLPNERVRDRLASLAVPYNGGLALVGDSNRRQISWSKASF